MWSLAWQGAENLTLRKEDQKYLDSFEALCWRRMEKTSWTDRVRNGELLRRAKKERNVRCTVNIERKLVTSCVGTAF
jgi:hypothetical protein